MSGEGGVPSSRSSTVARWARPAAQVLTSARCSTSGSIGGVPASTSWPSSSSARPPPPRQPCTPARTVRPTRRRSSSECAHGPARRPPPTRRVGPGAESRTCRPGLARGERPGPPPRRAAYGRGRSRAPFRGDPPTGPGRRESVTVSASGRRSRRARPGCESSRRRRSRGRSGAPGPRRGLRPRHSSRRRCARDSRDARRPVRGWLRRDVECELGRPCAGDDAQPRSADALAKMRVELPVTPAPAQRLPSWVTCPARWAPTSFIANGTPARAPSLLASSAGDRAADGSSERRVDGVDRTSGGVLDLGGRDLAAADEMCEPDRVVRGIVTQFHGALLQSLRPTPETLRQRAPASPYHPAISGGSP